MAPYKFSIIQISRLFHLLSIPANCGIFFKNNLTFTFCTFAHSFPADHIFCALHGPAQRIFTTTGTPPSPFLTVKESGTLNQAVCVRSSMVGVAPLPTGHSHWPPWARAAVRPPVRTKKTNRTRSHGGARRECQWFINNPPCQLSIWTLSGPSFECLNSVGQTCWYSGPACRSFYPRRQCGSAQCATMAHRTLRQRCLP